MIPIPVPSTSAGTSRIQVSAMDTASDEYTYNTTTAPITGELMNKIFINTRSPAVYSLVETKRDERSLCGVLSVHLSPLVGPDSSQ